MSYSDKILAKKEYYNKKAQQCDEESKQRYQNSRKLLDCVWGGQPILVGHHSEKKHRNLLKNVDNLMRKSCELDDKAEYYKRKAESVGNGGISILDENALDKLNTELTEAIQYHADMKAGKIEREHSHSLVYANNKIKQIRERIAQVEHANQLNQLDDEIYSYFKINYSDNRINVIFEGKPERQVIDLVKKHGFKWSPRAKVWTRVYTANALFSKKCLVVELLKLS